MASVHMPLKFFRYAIYLDDYASHHAGFNADKMPPPAQEFGLDLIIIDYLQ